MHANIVDSFIAGLNDANLDAGDDLFAEDFIFEEVAGPGERSREALNEELGTLRAAFPDLSFRPVRVSQVAERVYLEFRAMGTHLGTFAGVPATGVFTVISGVFNLAIKDDHVAGLRLTIDFAGLRRHLLTASRRSQ